MWLDVGLESRGPCSKSMQLPLAHLDASAIEEIPLDAWQELFEAVGFPESLVGASLSYEAILASFANDAPSTGLLHALEAIHSLGTELGRDALLEAWRDRHLDEAPLPVDCGEREFAVRLFALQKSDPAVEAAIVHARIKVLATVEQRSVHEFRGTVAGQVIRVGDAKAQLKERMLAHCKENDLGTHVQVDVFEDDGAWVFQVTHSDHTKTPLAIVDDGEARSMIKFRPVFCDVLRYEAKTGRLMVSARRASLVQAYVGLAGDAFFGDVTFFVGEAACTLTPLQAMGREALNAHNLPGVGRAWMTECTWRRGDRQVHRIRSVDCFEDIEALGLPISNEGELIEVKLKLQVADTSMRPATINVRIPGKISVTPPRHESIGHRYLEEIGVRRPASARHGLDLWGLHPWRHPIDTWRALLVDRADELVREGVLVPCELNTVAHPDIPGATLEVHRIEEGRYLGVGSSDEIPSKSLSPTDVEGQELSLSALARFIGIQLELPDGQVRVIESNVLDFGPLDLGEFRFRPFYLLSTPPNGLVIRLQRMAQNDHVVLLVPNGRESSSDLAKAELETPVPSKRELFRSLVFACGLENLVPAIHCARRGTRLVVDTVYGSIWVDGVKIEGLKPGTHPFKFVELLARACPEALKSTDLSRRLSLAREDGTAAARKAKRGAWRAIREALAAHGRELELELFPNCGGAYKCALQSEVAGPAA